MKAAKDLLIKDKVEIKPTERMRTVAKVSKDILDFCWKDAKEFIDEMDEEELFRFVKETERNKFKKIALINLRVSIHEYALVKLLSDKLKRPNASQSLLELARREILNN